MFKKLLLVSAISAAFTANPLFAQQQQQGGGQQNASSQIRLQEQTTGQGTPIYVSTSSVRQVQQALNQAGFDVGNIDGTWNDQTAKGAANYQRSKGLAPTGTLTLSLLNSLGLQNILNSPPQSSGGQGNQQWLQETAVGQGTPLTISPAGVRQIQQELNNRGYDVGNVDGQWSNQTARAAEEFQRANGLEPNGKPDINLIAALGGTQEIFQSSRESSGGNNMQWSQEEAAGSAVPVWASPATVRQVQQLLNSAGFNVGQVDGQWNQQTAQATKDFQRAVGLEPTGTLTTSLLAAIGQGNWTQGQVGSAQSASGSQGGQQSGVGQQQGQQQQGFGQSNQQSGSQGGFGQGGFGQNSGQDQQQQGFGQSNQQSGNQGGFGQGGFSQNSGQDQQQGFAQSGQQSGSQGGFGQSSQQSGGSHGC